MWVFCEYFLKLFKLRFIVIRFWLYSRFVTVIGNLSVGCYLFADSTCDFFFVAFHCSILFFVQHSSTFLVELVEWLYIDLSTGSVWAAWNVCYDSTGWPWESEKVQVSRNGSERKSPLLLACPVSVRGGSLAWLFPVWSAWTQTRKLAKA